MTGLYIGVGIAVLVVGLAIAAGLFHMRGRSGTEILRDEHGELVRLPLTSLQKRAWWSLGIGVGVTTAAVAILVSAGPTTFFESGTVRLGVNGILLAGVVAYLLAVRLTSCGADGDGGLVDERDDRIRSRAHAVQAGAQLVALAVWAIALTEVYWGEGTIPIVYPYLVFGSIFIVHVLSLSAGILIGYRRA